MVSVAECILILEACIYLEDNLYMQILPQMVVTFISFIEVEEVKDTSKTSVR